MPLYEFECSECGAKEEHLLPVGKSRRKCAKCGKNTLEKVISQTIYHDTYSPMHPRRGRGIGGYGRIDPGNGMDMGKNYEH